MVSISISVSNLHIPGSQSLSQYRKLHIPESQSQSVWYRNFRYFLVGTHLKALQNRNMFENLWWERYLFLYFGRVALILGHFATNHADFFTLKIWDQWGKCCQNDQQLLMGSVNASKASEWVFLFTCNTYYPSWPWCIYSYHFAYIVNYHWVNPWHTIDTRVLLIANFECGKICKNLGLFAKSFSPWSQ